MRTRNGGPPRGRPGGIRRLHAQLRRLQRRQLLGDSTAHVYRHCGPDLPEVPFDADHLCDVFDGVPVIGPTTANVGDEPAGVGRMAAEAI